jgi:hypothetical protein
MGALGTATVPALEHASGTGELVLETRFGSDEGEYSVRCLGIGAVVLVLVVEVIA